MNKLYSNIIYNEISIKAIYGSPKFKVYFVAENNRSKVISKFNELPTKTKELIKDLITKMATIKDFESPHIKYSIHHYKFGEIRPMPHRFFFFQKCGNNYIFFDYILKKVNSLPDNIYKSINEKKKIYEKEFQRYFEGLQ